MRRTIILLVALALFCLGTTLPAAAVPPEQENVEYGESGTVPAGLYCDFSFEFAHQYEARVQTFFDAQGEVTLVKMHEDTYGSWTNPATGSTLVVEGHRTLFIPADPEQPLRATGAAGIKVTLGGKNLFIGVGHVQIDQVTGELVFEAGRNPLLEGDFEEFCAALS